MPDTHFVLVAERRGISPRKRKREVIYATDSKARAQRDADDMAKTNRRMRFYVMSYEEALDVAKSELTELEQALWSAQVQQQKLRGT